MSIDSINKSTVTGASYDPSSLSGKAGKNTLTMDDFFQLMVAQMTNQDVYNTADSSEFISQMAQYSMVQAIADLSTAYQTSYGVNLIGKEVTLAKGNSDGTITTATGTVDRVNLYNGSVEVVVGGKIYDLSSVMTVQQPEAKK